MADQDDLIDAVMDEFIPLGEDHPVAQETFDAVKAALDARSNGHVETTETVTTELLTASVDTGIVRPGDTLILSSRDGLPPNVLAELRQRVADELPGVRAVILDGLTVEGIYRREGD